MATKFISVLLKNIVSLIMAACSIFLPVQPDNIPFTVEPVDTNDTRIVIEYKNTTNHFIIGHIGLEKLEKNIDGEWEKVDVISSRTEEAFYIYPASEFTDYLALDSGSLSKGEYRVTIRYNVLNKLREINTTGYSTATFTVIEAE